MKKVIKLRIEDESVLKTLSELAKRGKIERVEIEDKEYLDRVRKKIEEKLIKIKNVLEALRDMGISEELMVIYIADKTKVGKSTIKKILKAQTDFLEEFVRW